MTRPRHTPKDSRRRPAPPPAGIRWLLLIHQIPPKPDYLRVKIGRRLQRIGAVAIKNSVYALPANPECYEDFHWLVREIGEAGGDAFVSETTLGDGLTDAAVRARFDEARNEEYRCILADAKALRKAVEESAIKPHVQRSKPKTRVQPPALEHELARLRRRFESAYAIDYFGASEQAAVAELLGKILDELRRKAIPRRGRGATRSANGATWVTRRDVHVDRVASAWLISRFVDRRPVFRFVDANRYTHRNGELRFDMFEGEYTHVGDACTFETLVSVFAPDDAALRELAEIVHDVDCKDSKFRRDEAPGLARMIDGIVARCRTDAARIELGRVLFDTLYAALSSVRT